MSSSKQDDELSRLRAQDKRIRAVLEDSAARVVVMDGEDDVVCVTLKALRAALDPSHGNGHS